MSTINDPVFERNKTLSFRKTFIKKVSSKMNVTSAGADEKRIKKKIYGDLEKHLK